MIKDRGNIKWSSLMLVEHREKLKQLIKGEKEVLKPELDEHILDEMNKILGKALEKKLAVSLEYYKNRNLYKVSGYIEEYNLQSKELLVCSGLNKRYLSLDNIISIKIK
ncbi:YolD-like family protein [Halothermothrix orenii]|nr:YolD-like family protein [Halothermothrix orenii]